MKKIEKLLDLGNDYKVDNLEENNEKGITYKKVYISCKKTKDKCPLCGKYTSSIHDRLKPIELKGLKIMEYNTKIVIIKRRFICHRCNKKFTEKVDINMKNHTLSNKLEQKVLKDLLNYNLSLKYIAKENNISEIEVRRIFEEAMSAYPKYLKTLPNVISFDKFKADTKKRKICICIK